METLKEIISNCEYYLCIVVEDRAQNVKTFGKEKLQLDHENQKNIQRRTRVTLNVLLPFDGE